MKFTLNYLIQGSTLSQQEAKSVLTDIISQKYNAVQTAAFLTIYNMRLPNKAEMKGFCSALEALSTRVSIRQKTLDIVGTGGDGKDTFNISTLAALVCAGAGIPVAKHGNYASSSTTGSSDVLEYLGIKMAKNAKEVQQQIEVASFSFLHAPNFHPVLKNVAYVRKNLEIKTLFNILGPLVNPVKPSCNIIGVNAVVVGELYHSLFSETETDFNIIHSTDGYDELSLTANAYLWDKRRAKTKIDVKKLAGSYLSPTSIQGGKNTVENARIFMNVLQNKATAEQKKVVVYNAALGIQMYERNSFEAALLIAEDSLGSKKALKCLELLK